MVFFFFFLNFMENILKTKELINSLLENKQYDTNYEPVYINTNENIDGYMSKLNFSNKNNCLSVLSGGDHIFNASLYGIKNIDTFDINKLTEYFTLGLKRSAIITFNYNEFINFINKLTNPFTTLTEIFDLINLIIPNMDNKYRIFFKEIMDYLYKLSNNNQNLFYIFIKDSYKLEGYMVNTYLKNEENYNLLKNNLSKTNITFKNCDLTLLTNYFNKQYDFIFLSNILDYFFYKYGNNWNYQKLQELEKYLTPLLNNDGILALHYIYNYYYKFGNRYKDILINSSCIRSFNLTNENIITFEHVYKNQLEKNIDAGLMYIKKH